MICNEQTVGKPISTTGKILENIKNSPNQYYLTGSRFFGGSTDTSDWDFFVQESPEVLAELKKWGLLKLPKNENVKYFDKLMVCLFGSFYHLPISRQQEVMFEDVPEKQMHHVHVQVVSDATMKLRVQNALHASGLILGLNKNERKKMWNFGIALLANDNS